MAAFWISLANPLAQVFGAKPQIANIWVTHRHTEEALQTPDEGIKFCSLLDSLETWKSMPG